jgi:hypothetical protein
MDTPQDVIMKFQYSLRDVNNPAAPALSFRVINALWLCCEIRARVLPCHHTAACSLGRDARPWLCSQTPCYGGAPLKKFFSNAVPYRIVPLLCRTWTWT